MTDTVNSTILTSRCKWEIKKRGKIAAVFVQCLRNEKDCVMLSLVHLEANLPNLAMAKFSPETSEVFDTFIGDTGLAVGGVK